MNIQKKTILVVDDDLDFVEALSSFLETCGFRTLKAHDGEQGLKLAKMERPDLILLDIMMSERTEGFFTAREIRRTEELARVPIFVLSSLYSQASGFEIAPEAEWLAHDEFFSKPVNPSRLVEKIRERLGVGGG